MENVAPLAVADHWLTSRVHKLVAYLVKTQVWCAVTTDEG